MVLTIPWYFVHAILVLGTIYLFYHVYWDLTVGAARRRLIEQHGCKPIKRLPTIDPFLGLDFIWNVSKQIGEQRVLEGTQGRFKALGTGTFRFPLLGTTIIPTMEPENVKSILALDFTSFSLGEIRKGMVPLLGKGIFTTDGAAWQHSREMLRPMFVRSQLLEDLEMFERHAYHLIEAIPKDSSTVDLQELFFRFTLDLGKYILDKTPFSNLCVSFSSPVRQHSISTISSFSTKDHRRGNTLIQRINSNGALVRREHKLPPTWHRD